MFYVFKASRHQKDLALSDNRQIDPTLEYMYPIVLQLSANAPNPNAAKMFMEYLGTIEALLLGLSLLVSIHRILTRYLSMEICRWPVGERM